MYYQPLGETLFELFSTPAHSSPLCPKRTEGSRAYASRTPETWGTRLSLDRL
jgi:hypothetical protein